MNKNCRTKPDIDYPCHWLFKVIGSRREELENAISKVVGDRENVVTFSRSSSGGKFLSMNLELVVVSEEDRNSVYTGLSSHIAVKMVL